MRPLVFTLLTALFVPVYMQTTCTNTDPCLVSCAGCTDITMIADPTDCRRYYYCTGEQLLSDSPFFCPDGQEFNSLMHKCVFDVDADGCSPICSGHNGECHYTCQQGDPFIASLYDCNVYYVCDSNGISSTAHSCPADKPYFDGKFCQKNETRCCHCRGYCYPGDEGRLVVDPSDCRKYHVCLEEGVPAVTGTCDKTEYFDGISRQCSTEAPCRSMCRNVVGMDGCIENFTCEKEGSFPKCKFQCIQEYYRCYGFSDAYIETTWCNSGYVFDPQLYRCVRQSDCSLD